MGKVADVAVQCQRKSHFSVVGTALIKFRGHNTDFGIGASPLVVGACFGFRQSGVLRRRKSGLTLTGSLDSVAPLITPPTSGLLGPSRLISFRVVKLGGSQYEDRTWTSRARVTMTLKSYL